MLRTSVCAPTLGVLVALGMACAESPGDDLHAAASGPPNVILILADDLGWDDVGFHGSLIQTPNIDRLAAEGVILERMYTSPECTPTRYAIMTGKSPIEGGMAYHVIRPWSDRGLKEDDTTIADVFRDAGYQTALIGKWHLGHNRAEYHPNNHGFDYYYGTLVGLIDYFTHRFAGPAGEYLDWQRNGDPVYEKGYTATLLGADAARTIANRDPDKSFFLVLAFQSPHGPNMAPEFLVTHYKSIVPRRRVVHAAMVDALDRAVGTVLDTLDREGLADNTVVLFMSDNGGRPDTGGINLPLRGGKGTTFEGGIRVPAVVRHPAALPAGTRSKQLMRDYDLFPTLLAAAGLSVESASEDIRDAVNVWPAIARSTRIDRKPFFFATERSKGRYSAAAIDWPMKLHVEKALASGVAETTTQLFNIENDPNELKPTTDKALEMRLTRALEAWESRYPTDGIRYEIEAKRGAGHYWVPPTKSLTECSNIPCSP